MSMSMRKKVFLARKIIMGLIIAANSCMAGVSMAAPDPGALPEGGNVVKGIGADDTRIDQNGNQMDITQTADKAIINWDSFNIGENATVNFHHADSAGITLNRVVGNNMSEIYGHMNANGSIILVNPNGAYFADGCQVDAAGIIVSTEDLDQTKFLNDTYVWNQNKDRNANITIDGTVNVSNGTTASRLSYVNNKIMLIADGDVAIGPNGRLKATSTTEVSGDYTVGTEGFIVEGDKTISKGTIILRADQNADDVAFVDDTVASAAGTAYKRDEGFKSTSKGVKLEDTDTRSFKTAKVYLNNDKADQIQGLNVSVFYNSDVTKAGINGTSVKAIGVYSNNTSSPTTFTQKDYTKIGAEVEAYKAKVKATEDFNAYSLVNDVYQLQAIQDTKGVSVRENETVPDDKDDSAYYGNLAGSYAQGTNIDASDTANWVDGTTASILVGFNPIGHSLTETVSNNPFSGSYTGNGGSNSYGIYDMNITRSKEDFVGLFARTNDATISSTSMIDSNIEGRYHVGGITGYAQNSFFDGNTVRKRYKEADGEETKTKGIVNVEGTWNVGGIIGSADRTSTRNNTNGAYIKGVAIVGGLIGHAYGNQEIGDGEVRPISDDGKNIGWYSDTENLENGYKYGVVSGDQVVGGLVGYLDNGLVTGSKGSYSNGHVEGTVDDIGGLVGYAHDSEIKNSYNTNVASSSGNIEQGDYFDSKNVMGSGTSVYGRVSGGNAGTSVGGIAGFIDKTQLDTVYNAGNVSGHSNVGGLVGALENNSGISNSYNADNNTVYKSAKDDAEYDGFIYNNNDVNMKYTYNQDSQTWSRYTGSEVDTGDWTLSGESLTTEEILAEAPESGRLYLNRLAYRDATVTGSDKVGGIVGYIKAEDGMDNTTTLTNTYNAGRVKCSNSSGAAGTIIGAIDTGVTTNLSEAKANSKDGNFVVTTQNVTGKNIVKGTNTNMPVVGSDTSYTTAEYEKTINAASNWSSTTSNGVAWVDGADQNNPWIIYSNSTTPLLKQFMSKISTNRQYVYDGTVHDLTTDGVANYYGGAFFTGGKGKNVYTDGVKKITDYDWDFYKDRTKRFSTNKDGITASKDDDISNSSFYTYDHSDMWSPQHGYYTSGTAGVIITPKKIDYIINDNTKTYGENTTDSVVSGEFDSSALAKGDSLSGDIPSSYFESDGFSKTAKAGNYDIYLNSNEALKEILKDNYNYSLGSVIKGRLTVNPRQDDVHPQPEPTEPTNPTEPVEPIEPINPTKPIEPTDSIEPIVPDRYDWQYDSVYEGAKRPPQKFDVWGKRYVSYGSSYAPRTIRDSIRFLTIEDTGIRLDDTHLDNSIVIDKSSRVDGGDNVTIKRKAVVINNATMAK